MLKNQLRNFLRTKWIQNNIVFNIFAKDLDNILSLNGRFYCSNYISDVLKSIINGKTDIYTYTVDNQIQENVEKANSIMNNIFLSKVSISGIKGFLNTQDVCKKKDKHDCSVSPVIDLENRKSALIFGWNGEGKSSLTESIEFCLTGDVIEKKRRGIGNIGDYLLNTDSKNGFVELELFQPYNPEKRVTIKRILTKAKKAELPSVTSIDDNDISKDINNKLSMYEEFFARHFIERNRIENFVVSRGAENKEAYGKLIGLDDLNDFIKNSWKNFESQSKEDFFKEDLTFTNLNNTLQAKLEELTFLSEGQLRCFGLAILLSVSNKFKAKFIIFDDIVNAIDVEHRANIVKVLCTELDSPINRQLVITTHDKLFREKFINSVKNKNKILAFAFESKCMIIENTGSIDFERKILDNVRQKDCRTALVYMRIFLENIIYTMANEGKVKVEFKDEVYKYKLEKVFGAVAECYPEVKHIFSYFITDCNHLYWSILNQENHFWSEQGLCLDCQVIDEMHISAASGH